MGTLVLLAVGMLAWGRSPTGPEVVRDTLTLFDTSRQRPIPVAVYRPADTPIEGLPVIVFSHGHNENRSGTYLLYRWLLKPLATDGHVVVSVQHEQPGDPPLPMRGDLRVARLPFWEQGVANLVHVLRELPRHYPGISLDRPVLMGHSHGGDISLLFATRHPERLSKVISLDNRRFPLPRTASPRVYSVRSCDQPADPGVLPTDEERERYGITIVFPAGIGHNDMGSRGTEAQQAEVLRLVRGFLAQP
jgi:pimeloyl-ACP methyl ester carboxylesterase